MAQYTPKTWTTGETITAAELNAIEAAAAAAAVKADTDAAITAASTADRARVNHTGTQAASTITGLATVATSGAYTDLSAKPTIPTVGAAGAGAAVALSSTDASVTNSRTPTAHTHPAADLTATGTRDATTFLRGDNTWATPAGSGGGAGLPATIVNRTTAYTAAAGDFVQADVTSAGYTVTLPAAPAVGALVAVKKVDATANTLTIVPSGSGTIDGDANATTTTKMAGAIFEHVGSNVWRIVASMTTTGPAGPTGPQGIQGVQGATGQGVPTGGTTGQVLAKTSNTDYATSWTTPSGGGGGGTAVTTVTRSGFYMTMPGALGAVNPSVGYMFATPLLVPACTVDRIGLEILSATATAVVRLGIYADNGSMAPGTLTLDAGTIDASTAGYKEITISQALTAGFVWLVAVGQVAVAVNGLRGTAQTPYVISHTAAGLSGNPIVGMASTGGTTTGALPTTFGASQGGVITPRILVRAV